MGGRGGVAGEGAPVHDLLGSLELLACVYKILQGVHKVYFVAHPHPTKIGVAFILRMEKKTSHQRVNA